MVFGLEGWGLLLLCGEGESDGGCKGVVFGLEGWELLLLCGEGGRITGGFVGSARTRAKASSCATLNLRMPDEETVAEEASLALNLISCW